jgi:hypothetical protein
MSITLRPIHLAIIGAFLAGIVVAAVIALMSSGGESTAPARAPLVLELEESPTAAPSPTSQPTVAPTAAPTTGPEAAAPPIRSCEEIRAAGTYNSAEERAFFLANCIDRPQAAAPAPQGVSGPTPPITSGATTEEEAYRRRAEGKFLYFYARIAQYLGQPSFGALNDLLELGAVCRNFASELNGLEPVPPRFRQVHDQLRAALVSFADHIAVVQNQTTAAAQSRWISQYISLADRVGQALEDYALVVGIDS